MKTIPQMATEVRKRERHREWERKKKLAELHLLNCGWMPERILFYLATPANVQKVLDAAELRRLTDDDGIPPERRTKPLSFRQAAKHMGKGNSKDAAEWLSKSVADGSIACKSVTRQSHIFDRNDFPKEVWRLILPKD